MLIFQNKYLKPPEKPAKKIFSLLFSLFRSE